MTPETPHGLVRAIRAALDETDRLAREVGGAWRLGIVYGTVFDATAGVTVASTPYEAAAQHITHNDPAAVLRRVAADREILAEHSPERRRVTFTDDEGSTNWGEFVCVTCYSPEVHRDFDPSFPCPTVRALARGLGINPETETPQ